MSTRPARFWVVTLATVITMAVTAALGFWQLDRAGQKRALQAQIEQRGQLAPWSTPELLQAADPLAGLHRPVQLSGRWVQGASLFLDNRQMNARVGFFVITPLRLAGSDRAILVQRGWVARDFNDRSRVPAVARVSFQSPLLDKSGLRKSGPTVQAASRSDAKTKRRRQGSMGGRGFTECGAWSRAPRCRTSCRWPS